MSRADELENIFIYKNAGAKTKRRKLVKTKAASPFGPASKYPDNLLKVLYHFHLFRNYLDIIKRIKSTAYTVNLSLSHISSPADFKLFPSLLAHPLRAMTKINGSA